MKDLATINGSTGLSDEELALFLEVSKGTIYNWKMKIRDLPSPALLKLGQLEADRNDPEKVELATAKLREAELMKLDVLIKYREAHMHKLKKIINNKELKALNMNHSLKKKLLAIQSRSLALNINENKNVSEPVLATQKNNLLNTTATFHENGPVKLLELTLDIERLKAELSVTETHIEQLLGIAKQIKELPVAEWPLLLNPAE